MVHHVLDFQGSGPTALQQAGTIRYAILSQPSKLYLVKALAEGVENIQKFFNSCLLA